jgi:transcriptional regulator with XRE-family HTH domain
MSDGQIDRFVKARWREIGISQSDLAEVLGAAADGSYRDGGRRPGENGRLRQIAEALELPADLLSAHLDGKNPGEATNPAMQSLLDLRLLRAFRELQDHDTKRVLVHLAEHIVKCRANRGGEAD